MALPKGMTLVVRDSWDRIDEVVTDEILNLGDNIDDADSALDGINPDYDMFGCGYWGCAYPTNVSRWALKLSTDPYEGPISKAIMDDKHLRNHLGVAYFVNMWQLDQEVRWGKSEWRKIWVILRENIDPIKLGLIFKGRKGTLADLLHTTRVAAAAANSYDRSVEKYGRSHGRYRKLVRSDVLWSRGLQLAGATSELFEVADFQLDFYETFGARLADIHVGNVGYRKHDLTDLSPDHERARYWVAFDVGHSHVETGSEVPMLKNPIHVPTI